MPQEKDKYMEIHIFIRFRWKDGYVGFDLCWYGWRNWVMMNMMMTMMEMMKRMMSLILKTLPYRQGMHLV
jgi:hypothetical protein